MNRLKELRKAKGDTKVAIGEAIGVSSMTIARWEEQKELNIKKDKAQALADYFDVPVGYLLGYEEARRDYLTSTLEKYVESMESPAGFAGYGLLALTRGQEVTDKAIENLRQFNDYYGTKALNSDEAKEWDEEGKAEILQAVQSYADKNIERFLAGLMAMNHDVKYTIIDFLTLDADNREAISKIISSLADNPVFYKDFND
ncbi:transcriptional regulator with XRE-family HTH domain [Streptococcus gallinaceus]|uniref:helix-turn-helix domain-containing protein n=1 Tax=Streptococcus gallinaceus TaxID=165758 RepID=UPI0020A08713|nr:helix-turn-helix transcriptional regulator [Streptococcus gallinaceus]MCP1639664.1 transcriptional regulator with XRE-family HTH domain [Streptococcus gallinaceus]MCP1770447.1 transcriptional regulator with XRE-family HTH domain [Streptococcus gallinaceus]